MKLLLMGSEVVVAVEVDVVGWVVVVLDMVGIVVVDVAKISY